MSVGQSKMVQMLKLTVQILQFRYNTRPKENTVEKHLLNVQAFNNELLSSHLQHNDSLLKGYNGLTPGPGPFPPGCPTPLNNHQTLGLMYYITFYNATFFKLILLF